MDKTALILIVGTNVALISILAALSFLIYRLLRNQTMNDTLKDPESMYHPGILARMKEIKEVKSRRAELFCPNHPEEPGEVTCAICDKLYCQACIKPYKTLHFCKEHLPLIMRNEWNEVLTIKTSTQFPEEGVKLYDSKKRLFEEHEIPVYIETHYKINVDQDFIETYLVMFAIREDVVRVREKMRQLDF